MYFGNVKYGKLNGQFGFLKQAHNPEHPGYLLSGMFKFPVQKLKGPHSSKIVLEEKLIVVDIFKHKRRRICGIIAIYNKTIRCGSYRTSNKY